MRILKTKLATAAVLAIVMFGVFSFTTTPVAAQGTISSIILTPQSEEEAISYSSARKLAGIAMALGALAVEAVASLFGAVDQEASYPGDSLD